MPKILREHCLAKIAEIEQKIAGGLEPDVLADYYLMLACWRWLMARAVDEPEEAVASEALFADGSGAAEQCS